MSLNDLRKKKSLKDWEDKTGLASDSWQFNKSEDIKEKEPYDHEYEMSKFRSRAREKEVEKDYPSRLNEPYKYEPYEVDYSRRGKRTKPFAVKNITTGEYVRYFDEEEDAKKWSNFYNKHNKYHKPK
jgi:hypothetical protein